MVLCGLSVARYIRATAPRTVPAIVRSWRVATERFLRCAQTQPRQAQYAQPMSDVPDAFKAMMEQFFANLDSAQSNWRTPLEIVRASFPFDVQPDHQADSFHYALHEHGDYIATGGRSWDDDRRRGLRTFYAMLRQEHLVITYDPRQGWGYAERQSEDEDMIVRIDDITDEQEIIWRFPPDDLAP